MADTLVNETSAFIEQLGRLGIEKDSEKRLALLRGVADLYLSRTVSPTLAEEYLFSEIANAVLRKLQPHQRPQVSTALCDSERVPHSLALALASDSDIEVARPVLSRSPVLTEGDIVALAQASSDEHLQAIATRASLTARVTDVLIDRGSNTVLRTVSGNAGAEFSEQGMLSLVTRAREDDELSLALADRGDLSPAVLEQLNGLICARVSAEAEGDDTSGTVASLRARAQALITEELRKRKANIGSTERVIAAVEAGSMTLDDGLGPLLAGGRLLDLSQVLAHFLRFDRNFVFQQMAAGEINTIVLAFRALNIAYPHLEATLALRARKRRSGQAGETTVTRQDYEAINPADAQRAMRFLKVRMTVGRQAPTENAA
ncbi:DUF2336 domain-containing protein [Phreatobacter cathodiphilus]|uniref:DUF2336 domain-containing protein n=1 Tax=Phreatobacter cathodiphilus TaxID=1868589 RepID=A0A2S0NDA6_9HYPH|nr:DUF2336 domain-containing protein [Phreatobacter cathodiphilus]AVO46164.1 hypothetical protein C6569_14425 [Phreatobacter cathodiphilus]